ncbi:MAG: LysR family transcriptional regulator [Candidatus Methylacidiphilales bacterium]|nr:LysR family transcriptional regulator [Candidatus Methylacidiphilales bacterium]
MLSENGLSLERLRNFALVVEAGSICAVTEGDPARQSLISRQIRELETFFATELTRRKGRGLEITDAGRELARQICLQFQSLHDFKQTQATVPLEVRLATGNSVLECLVIPMLAREPATTGLYRWSYRVMRTREVVEGLLDHSLDFGLIRRNVVSRPLKYLHLRRIGYALYVPGEWPVQEVPALLETCPWAVTAGGEFRRHLDSAARLAGITLRPSHTCTSFTQAAQLVSTGLAAAMLPRIVSTTLPASTRELPLPWLEEHTRTLGLVWHPRNLEVRPALDPVRCLLYKGLLHSDSAKVYEEND